MVATVTDLNLRGLPRRLVQDGIVEEAALETAGAAARKEKVSLVSYLVDKQLANPRDIAVAASQEFGVPLLDLDAVGPRSRRRPAGRSKAAQQTPRAAAGQARQASVRRGRPTRPTCTAVDEIKFQTGLAVEAVVVEDDKLEARWQSALEAVDTSMSSLSTTTTSTSRTSRSSGAMTRPSEDISRDDIEDAPVVRFVNKICSTRSRKGASDIHFEPYEKTFRVRTAHGRRAQGSRAAAGRTSRARSPRASRSCRGSTSPSAACRRTAASR